MSRDETLAFYREELAFTLETVSMSKDRDKLVLNFNMAFEYQLLIAMVLKRASVSGASTELAKVADIFMLAQDMMRQEHEATYLREFLLPEISFVEYIISGELSYSVRSDLHKVATSALYHPRRVQALLLLYLSDGSLKNSLTSAIRESEKDSAVFAQNFRSYQTLIEVGRSSEFIRIDEKISDTVAMYEGRVKHSYFSGGREINGGMDGHEIVDFRLGAILRYLRSKGVDQNYLSGVHFWG